jgi:Uncharacterized conserved protein (DUF2340)
MSEQEPEVITITVRLIKSFTYRTFKNIVLHVPRSTRVSDLKLKSIEAAQAFRAFKTHPFDALKLYVKAHGSKTSNLIINLDDGEILGDEMTLAEYGFESNDEISFFNMKEYMEFKDDPQVKW